MKTMIVTVASLAVLAVAATALAEKDADAVDGAAAPPLSRESALSAWEKVYEVFSHPRCVNCHVPEDNRPRWSGPSYGLAEGEWLFHGMNVNGGQSRIGVESIPCMTCHQSANADVPHGPPGAPVWALAPVEMVWWEKSSQDICEQIKDPARNGGRTLQDVADHVDHDALVHWGWDPGPGREPAPYSVQEIVAALEGWAAAGAPCPPTAE